ncbi:hypothetical protein [Wolbachia endosymbiont of Wuchereria bancrofti]|uniref:hypothetical protein n=1 Tax=Wolbachia endosymbiont of Wuchereria bancrofti TaxID=96496 RepID=UPI000B4CAD9E|nr:hypothetical protein [Wolbachia endosymbiont of Wuchereria bancrofti]
MKSCIKMKRLCVLVVLLTLSLASAANCVVADLEGQYYGLNFGAGWNNKLCDENLVLFLVIVVIRTLNLNLRFSYILITSLIKIG